VRALLLVLVAAVAAGAAPPRAESWLPAPSGRIAFSERLWPASGDNWDVLVIDAAGGTLRNLTRDGGCDDASPAWSRDGNALAYVCGGIARPSRAGLYVMRADSSGRRRIVAGDASSPSWSPDGRRLAFHRDGWLRLVRVRDGTAQRLARASATTSAWSPDGRTVVFGRDGRQGGIWRIRVDGGGSRRLTRHRSDAAPTWSPDGTTIAFVRDGRLWLMRPDGTAQRAAPVGAGPAAWAPDSRHFAYSIAAPGPSGGVWVVDLRARDERRIAPCDQCGHPSWGPAAD
jgi:TolB protein